MENSLQNSLAVLNYKSLISVTSMLKSSFWKDSFILLCMFYCLGTLITISSGVFRREHSLLFHSWNICKFLHIRSLPNLVFVGETSL